MSYSDAHAYVVRIRGKASTYNCSRCNEKATEWAYLHTGIMEEISPKGFVYSYDTESYEPMCRSCHRKFDNYRRITHCPQGHSYEQYGFLNPVGHRKCLICTQVQYKRSNAKKGKKQ